MGATCPVLTKLTTPVHVSHRGGRHPQFGPENTLYSYRKSVNEYKTQVLEIDLWLSKDGHIMLYHDTDVNSNTDGKGCINDLSLYELKQLDAAYYFTQDNVTFPLRGKGYTIPTLDEVLDEFLPVKDLVFFFDFKDDHPINLALDTIKKRNMQDRVILGAVIPEINRKLLKKKPKTIPLAADFETMQNIHAAFKQGTFGNLKVKHEIVGFMIDESRLALLDEQIFDAFKEKGKWIALFGPALDNEETIQKAISLGTHLILSDRPDVLRQILDKNV